MKRLVIAIIIMALMLGISGLSLFKLYDTKTEMLYKIEEIRENLNVNQEKALKLSYVMHDRWHEIEPNLLRYIRHAQVDDLTVTIARIPALIEYADNSESAAELDRARVLLKHIWESELPTLVNIF